MTESSTLPSTELSTELPGTSEKTNGTGAASNPKEASRLKRIIKRVGWVLLGVYCLVFFTLLKLPEDRVRNYIQGYIAYQLSQQDISFSADKSSLSFAFGIKYTMKDVTLNFPAGQDPVKISEVSVSPSILSLLMGKLGASIHLENKGGSMDAFYKMPLSGAGGSMAFDFSAKNLDLGSLGILPVALGIKGSGVINGDGRISGNLNTPATLDGKIDFSISKITINQQTIMGFSVPQLTVSQIKIDLDIEGGKGIVKTIQVGQQSSSTDDIKGTMTGDITFGKVLPYSTLNLKTNFSLSQTILKSFILLDALLGNGKVADGSYSFVLSGNLSAPNFLPASQGDKH